MESSEGEIEGKWRYSRLEKLKYGTIGEAFKGTEISTGLEVVVKEVNLRQFKESFNEKDKKLIREKIKKNSKVSSRGYRNIAKTLGHHIEDDMLYLVYEAGIETTLGEEMKSKKYAEHEALMIAHQLASGLSLMHVDIHIIHGCLSPQNILYQNGQCKIIDFGLALDEEETHQTKSKTTKFQPLESLDTLFDAKPVDVWSLGVILHQLLFSTHPFISTDCLESSDSLVNSQYQIPSSSEVSQQTKDLLKKCFDKDRKNRITVQEIKNYCGKFLKNIGLTPGENEKGRIKYRDGIYDGELKGGKPEGKRIAYKNA